MDNKMRNACRSGDLEYIQAEINKYKQIYQKDDQKYTHPLFFCASGGQNDCIDYFQKEKLYNGDIIIESIGIAAISGHLSTVEKLFKILGKNFNKKHPRLINALNVCIKKKNRKIIDCLIDKGIMDEDSEENIYIIAAAVDEIEALKNSYE